MKTLFNLYINMKILIILPYIPYPLDSGGNQATFFMIDQIRKVHQVSLCFDICGRGVVKHVDSNKSLLVEQLKEKWPDVTFYSFQGQRKFQKDIPKLGTYGCILKALEESFHRKYIRKVKHSEEKRSNGELMIAPSPLFEKPRELDEGFLHFIYEISRKGFDCVQIEMYEYLHLVYLLPKTVKRIFIHHEIRFVRNYNTLNLFHTDNLNDIILYHQLKAQEIGALNEYDCIVNLSDYDKKTLSKYIEPDKIHVSPAGVCFSHTENKFKMADEFVFVGSGNHQPNMDGLLWFTKEILPNLRKLTTNIKIHIVGKWNEAQQEVFSHNPELIFEGFIEDLTSFICGKISIVPVRIGSGIRIKILEAVNAYSPIITTVKGVEGIKFENNNDCIITDSPVDFAKFMFDLLQNKEKQKSLCDKAHMLLDKEFSNDNLVAKRLEIYE